jgi:membrane associated rhomboid family serine protease
MHLDVPDPAYTGSLPSRALFRVALRIAFGFVALLWIIELATWMWDLDPALSGVRPRQLDGLPGIVFAPLVHAGVEHLLANSAPLLVLITTMVFLYPRSAIRTLPAVWLGTGLAVWLFGRESIHLGASGLVYGLASYVLVAGVLRRDTRAIAAALVVWFMYGSLVWGALPTPLAVSWETHLAAALVGVALAVALRHLDRPPRKRYDWERETDEARDASSTPERPDAESDPAHREAAR